MMDVIYTVPRKAYLTPLILVSFALFMGIIPFLVRLITEIEVEIVACFAVFCFIMAGLSLLLSVISFFRLRTTYIKITPMQMEIVAPKIKSTLFWDEVEAYYQDVDEISLYTAHFGFAIPCNYFANENLVRDIRSHLQARVFTDEALEVIFPPAKLYRELLEKSDFAQTIPISWSNFGLIFVFFLILFKFLINDWVFIIFVILLGAILGFIMFILNPKIVIIDIHGVAVHYRYRNPKQFLWRELKWIKINRYGEWLFQSNHNRLAVPSASYWQIDEEAKKTVTNYILAQSWKHRVPLRGDGYSAIRMFNLHAEPK